MWTFWYIREASVALLIANVPNCWPLFRKVFHLRSFHHAGSYGNQSRTTNTQGLPITASRTRNNKITASVNLSVLAKSKDRPEVKSQTSWWERESGQGGTGSRLGRTESEERIVVRSEGPAKVMPLEIWESKEYEVDRGSVSQTGFETSTTITASVGGRSDSDSDRTRR